jgi:hypothetical protein
MPQFTLSSKYGHALHAMHAKAYPVHRNEHEYSVYNVPDVPKGHCGRPVASTTKSNAKAGPSGQGFQVRWM